MIIDNDESYAKEKLSDYKRRKGIEEHYCDKVVLSKIKPHEDNQFINKETQFPIVANLTDMVAMNERNDEKHISRRATGWIYFDRLSINTGENISINGNDYTIEAATIRQINKREMVVRDNSNDKLSTIDLRKPENLDEMYKILNDKKIKNSNVKKLKM